MPRIIILLFWGLLIYSCNKREKNPAEIMKEIYNLEKIKKAPKFKSEYLYPGLANEYQREGLSKTLDEVVNEFEKATKENFSDFQYQELMKKEIVKFNVYNLDTEDREYICGFFEKIMNAIGLESSGGALNDWLYGELEPVQRNKGL